MEERKTLIQFSQVGQATCFCLEEFVSYLFIHSPQQIGPYNQDTVLCTQTLKLDNIVMITIHRIQSWLSVQKSMNVIHHINKLKKKNHMIIDAQKTFEKN